MKGKPKHLSLRIDEDLLRKFEYVAKYDDRSMNWYLLHLIKNEIAELRSEVVVVKCGKKIRRIYFSKNLS